MNLINVLEMMISKVIENPAQYKRSPGAVVQTTIIVDAEGFTMSQATYKPGRYIRRCLIFYDLHCKMRETRGKLP